MTSRRASVVCRWRWRWPVALAEVSSLHRCKRLADIVEIAEHRHELARGRGTLVVMLIRGRTNNMGGFHCFVNGLHLSLNSIVTY